MSPVPEDDIKDPVNEDVDNVENMEFPPVMIADAISDSDDADEEFDQHLGNYQLLPQEPNEIAAENNAESVENLEDDTTDNPIDDNQQTWRTSGPADSQQPHLSHYPDGTAPSYLQVADLPTTDKKDLLWNQLKKNVDSIQMDEGHAAEIKAAMAGFQLPLSHVPDWAKNVSDDQWKEKVISRITTGEKTVQASNSGCTQSQASSSKQIDPS